ncbi:MAG: NYN domain-containing protein [Actinobacteria bacterium]|nr:MAG: NYN domain-containing protein [Actinomycetota bacterium]
MEEERIALFIDYENLAIGAREALNGMAFDFEPIANALAERGRVIARKAYADWTMFDDARQSMTRSHVELIEIPQRMGASRKNAADIKMVVDAIEMAFERGYVGTFVICTGDSDFTPLVHKLRELNKKVIGVGVKASTSNLLPPACDEFLFYENLEGVEPRRVKDSQPASDGDSSAPAQLESLITTTLAGLSRSGGGEVLASSLKRALLRKDSTFSEADHGYRAFGELLRDLESQGVIELSEGPGRGDPVVQFPSSGSGEEEAFALLGKVVQDLSKGNGNIVLSGLKNQLRKVDPDFSEKKFGYGGFLQFCKGAARRGLIELDWDDSAEDYRVSPA